MIRVSESAVIDAPIVRVWEVLRDFNSHSAWHPAIAESHIEGGRPSDEVGALRVFRLSGGERLSERLLKLSDRAHAFSYAIERSDVPLGDYVAHVELKPVTSTGGTFLRWWSSFRAPRGREAEMRDLVSAGVYRAGIRGLREFLGARQAPVEPARAPRGAGQTSPGAMRTQAVVMERHGAPEVLRAAEVEVPPPGPGEVRLRQTVIGVNFIDVYSRTGYFRLVTPPGVPGMEAAGVVIDAGAGVDHLKPGDRVSYACAPPGAYAARRTMPAGLVLPLPEDVDDRTAAALTLKGVTAYFLLHKVHRLQPGETALIYAPAGGVGQLLVAWAHAIGAVVIGATSDPAKRAAALVAGADHVVAPGRKSLEDQVRALTGGRGADVVFDAVGRDSFDHSVAALKPCGHLVSFGQASGDIGMRDVGAFAAGSLTLSRPNYGHYTDTRAKMTEATDALWEMFRRAVLRPRIGLELPLAQAAEAHRALETGRTTGVTLLIPEEER